MVRLLPSFNFSRTPSTAGAAADSHGPNSAAVKPGAAATGGKPEMADVVRMGDTAVATLTVMELSAEDGAALLGQLLGRLAQSGATSIVLDLQNVQYIDSRCLGSLVAAANELSARSGAGRIALVNPAHGVEHLFRLTRLDRVFPIYSDVMTALKAIERLTAGPEHD
jgi:anti-sigma B factor antagonist